MRADDFDEFWKLVQDDLDEYEQRLKDRFQRALDYERDVSGWWPEEEVVEK